MFIEEENNNIIDAQEVEVVPQEKDNSDYVMKLPDSEKFEEPKIEPNRPPMWSMRIAGGLIDLCLMFLFVLGMYSLFKESGLGNRLRELQTEMIAIQDQYKMVEVLEEEGNHDTYGYPYYSYEEDYETKKGSHQEYSVPDSDYKYVVLDYENHTDELTKAYVAAVKADDAYKSREFDYHLIDYGILCLGGFIAETVYLLVIPLTNKRRATFGKLLAGTQVINDKYEVRAKWYQMLFRYLWTFIFEGALVYLFLSTYTTFLVPLILFIITLTNKKRRTLHDFVTRTRVIDARSYVPLEEQT